MVAPHDAVLNSVVFPSSSSSSSKPNTILCIDRNATESTNLGLILGRLLF